MSGGVWRVRLADAVALLVVVATLSLPDRLTATDFGSFAAIPVEVILGAALLLVLPPAVRLPAGTVLACPLGLLTVLKIVDACFYAALSRPFDLVLDWGLAGGAWTLLASSLGVGLAALVVLAAALFVVGVLTITLWAVRRLTRRLTAHPLATTRVVMATAAVWLVCSLTGVVLAAPYPVASHASATKVVKEITGIRDGRQAQQAFAAEIATDHVAATPADQLLTGLKGKRVLLVFVESYGRVAVDDPTIGAQIRPVLDAGTSDLAARGIQARSGYLTSPIAGGGSWLAHSTLLSGTRIDHQRRYLTLVASNRFTLTEAFHRAGWRTLGIMPGVTRAWPEGAFYHYDKIYDSFALGYAGPVFGWSRLPDQYTLSTLDRLATSTPRQPAMAVVPLITSHAPWSVVPPMVSWDDLGDGTVYGSAADDSEQPEAILTRDPARVRNDYARSIGYSLQSLISYTAKEPGDDLVVIMVGDHQPAPAVTGPDAGKDVPITLISGDPAVLKWIDDWGWTPGLRPAPNAPVWPMESFRDRFLAAYGG
ncbi:MAG: CDP-alcohol phosphatidyltransferase family protein [Microlunatus sp.]